MARCKTLADRALFTRFAPAGESKPRGRFFMGAVIIVVCSSVFACVPWLRAVPLVLIPR